MLNLVCDKLIGCWLVERDWCSLCKVVLVSCNGCHIKLSIDVYYALTSSRLTKNEQLIISDAM